MPKPKLAKKATEVAGEYLVAAKLWLKECVAVLAPRNFPHVDIFLPQLNKAIQVKTSYAKNSFQLAKFKSEEDLESRVRKKSLFYTFVHIGEDREKIRYFIVPSDHVAKLVREHYYEWLKRAKHIKPVEEIKFEEQVHGVLLSQLENYEDRWEDLLK